MNQQPISEHMITIHQ